VGRRRTEAGVEEYVNVEERLRPYLDASTENESQRAPGGALDDEFLDELMERAVNLLALMPVSQRRETIEDLLSPYDLARGRRAVDALIGAAVIAEDHSGHLHLLR
jgi:hypothetical protein